MKTENLWKRFHSIYILLSSNSALYYASPKELPRGNQPKGGMAMKEFFKKAFPNSRRVDAKRKSKSWQKSFQDSLAEGYGLNYLDSITTGEMYF